MDLRDKEADLRKEMDMLKNQRADNWREINRLKDWQNYLEDQERDYRGSAGYNHYGFMK